MESRHKAAALTLMALITTGAGAAEQVINPGPTAIAVAPGAP